MQDNESRGGLSEKEDIATLVMFVASNPMSFRRRLVQCRCTYSGFSITL